MSLPPAPMVALPAGTAVIGSPEDHLNAVAAAQHYPRAWFEDETPQHAVAVDAFWIDRNPVTNAAFAAFADATGYLTLAERRGFGLVYGDRYWQERTGACWRHPDGMAEYAAHGPAWRCWPWGDDWDPRNANSAELWARQPITAFAAWRTWWAGRRARHGDAPRHHRGRVFLAAWGLPVRTRRPGRQRRRVDRHYLRPI